MLRAIESRGDYDVMPQAIIWRPLDYFTGHPAAGEDGLDVYRTASFLADHHFQFDIRTYDGHPQETSSLYFPIRNLDELDTFQNEEFVQRILRSLLRDLSVPDQAIAWFRGADFELGGVLKRPENDHLGPEEAEMLILKALGRKSGHSLPIDNLINSVSKLYPTNSGGLSEKERDWLSVILEIVNAGKLKIYPEAAHFFKNHAVLRKPGEKILVDLGYLSSD